MRNFDESLIVIPYGSRIYGSYTSTSDFDYIAIHQALRHGEQLQVDAHTSVQCHTPESYQNALDEHSPTVLESFFYARPQSFVFRLNKSKLRESFSAKASNSFVKAKKKILLPEESVEIGLKSLYHSIRIIKYGIQIAQHGRIIDWKSSRFTMGRIRKLAEKHHNREQLWEVLKNKYQPVYNSACSEFRIVAPK